MLLVATNNHAELHMDLCETKGIASTDLCLSRSALCMNNCNFEMTELAFQTAQKIANLFQMKAHNAMKTIANTHQYSWRLPVNSYSHISTCQTFFC